MNTRHFLLSIVPLLSGFAAATAVAGDGKSFSTSQQSTTSVEDLGVIEEEAAVKFRGDVSTVGTYTSNAKLTGNHASGDFLFFPTVEGGVNAKLGKGFTFDLDAKIESAVYSRFDERSFIGYSATTTLDWRPKPNLPRIYIGAEPYRYDSYDNGGLISQAIGLTAGTDWGFGFNNGNTLAFFGYSFTHYYADPGIDTLSQNRVLAGITHHIAPKLYGQLIYAFQHSNYDEVSRRDLRHIAIVNLSYQINAHLFTTLSGNFVDNDSTQLRASYQSAGASLGLTWQF